MATERKSRASSRAKGASKGPSVSRSASVGAKKLVIVESPAKARTINRYLGSEYVVKASMGHVRDLPSRNPKGVNDPVPGVDVEHEFRPTYQPLADRRKVLADLKQVARGAGEVFLATDLDREGEAIAWHLAESLGVAKDRLRRVIFNEITNAAIREAFANPRNLDMNKVNAQQARRILDRIVGYQVSPLLWRKVARGLSAGRVQSVAVRLIVDRERQIAAFDPEEYWRLGAVFTPDLCAAPDLARPWSDLLARRDEKGNPPSRQQQQEFLESHNAFRAELVSLRGAKWQPDSAEPAVQVARALGLEIREIRRQRDESAKGAAQNRVVVMGAVAASRPRFVVRAVNRRQTRPRPPAPFTTAALQQAASVQLRFPASRTMRTAQQLYEGVEVPGEGSVGLITYMRTDSTNLSREAVANVRSMIAESFGQQYLPEKPNVYASGERAQEAHEAIRPTDPRRRPEDLREALSQEQWRLYDLIWRRFVACQMAPAVWSVTEADIVAATDAGEAVFKAMGRTLEFDGFYRVAGVPRGGDQLLPELAESAEVAPIDICPTQHFTQAPPRYTEASLVKALEADGIGRPSTYASIIQTIQDRNYVRQADRVFYPTELGTVVTDKLVQHFPRVFDVRFTAHMEDQLDRVEEGVADWVRVLNDFYGPFSRNLELAAEQMVHARAESKPSEYACQTCGRPMVYRLSPRGEQYLACTGYPECRQTYPVDREGKRLEQVTTDVACPRCGKAMILRRGRFGPFLSCSGYPQCSGLVKLDRKGCVRQPSAPPLSVDLPCPKCKAPLNLRRNRRGPWLSCSKYPRCRGRLAWSALPEEQRADLERRLSEHEKAHPVPVIRTLDGKPVPENYRPGAEAQPDSAPDDEPAEE